MRNFLLIFLFSFAVGFAIPTIDESTIDKTAPQHIGVDKGLLNYYVDYQISARARGIKFTNSVTMGFSKIKMNKGNKMVVGLCSYGKNFREIDVDLKFWKESSALTKRTLLYHEMTHCFCYRDHDWGDGSLYPDPNTDFGKILMMLKRPFYKTQPGFFQDNCPMSIMYPEVVSDPCSKAHWAEYEKEMFNRCIPY